MPPSIGQTVVFNSKDGKLSVNVQFDEDTAWLSIDQMATLFDRDKSTISRHIKNVYGDGESSRCACRRLGLVVGRAGRGMTHLAVRD